MQNEIKYVIVPDESIEIINLDDILGFGTAPCRFEENDVRTYIKYIGPMPLSVSRIFNKSQEYSHSELMTFLQIN